MKTTTAATVTETQTDDLALDFAMFDLPAASPEAARRIDAQRTAARYRKVTK